jgi:hypothetical protein
MGREKRRGHPLRRWAIPGTGLGGPRRRRLVRARTEPAPHAREVDDIETGIETDIGYRDASGVLQGGRDGIGWTRYGGID